MRRASGPISGSVRKKHSPKGKPVHPNLNFAKRTQFPQHFRHLADTTRPEALGFAAWARSNGRENKKDR
jgi:hypothetical protein